MRPRAVEAYLACTKRAGEGPRLPSSLTSRPIAGKYSREGNTGVQADEWLRFRDFDPIRTRTLHSLRTVDGMACGSSVGLDSPWLQQVRSDRSPKCAPRPCAPTLRIGMRMQNHSASGNRNAAITTKASSRRMVRFASRPAPSDQIPTTKPPKQGQRADDGRSGSESVRDRRAMWPDQAWAGFLFRFGEHCLF
jgi:hypothetical protein